MMKNGLAGLMKQAQQMQENMKRMQEQLATIEVEGQSGAGLVKVTMTCRHDVKRVTIDESLLKDDKDMLEDLVAAAMNDAVRRVESTVQEKMGAVTAGLPLPLERIRHCEKCNSYAEEEVCVLCRSPRRDATLLCVVETPADLLMMEQAQCYQGLYFVLMGALSPLDGIGPREIHLDRLIKRATDGAVQETILATNFTVEGAATTHYVSELLGGKGLRLTRIARGLPVGGELEHVDSGTLAQAVLERRPA